MQYKNLQELLSRSASSRQYFLSLPVPVQRSLHERGPFIHSADDLHVHAHAVERYARAVAISEML